MKPANLHSLLQAKSSLNDEHFNAYLNHHKIAIRKTEIDDLEAFARVIKGAGASVGDLNKIYFGYKIPQIGKEFDLLRFGRESIINIELKSVADPAKIHAQLLRNQYYLKFIGRAVYAFTFVSSTGSLYYLAENNRLVTISPNHLQDVLSKQIADETCAPDSIFNPSDYLVSPFNSTQKFLAGEYFLTHQQEEFKEQILKSINSTTDPKFAAITGGAGTGKTLLTFDIVKHLLAQERRILTIHCGQLNDGHEELKKSGWNICSIRDYRRHDVEKFDVIVVDEAQRIYPDQLSEIVSKILAANNCCIFSYDKIQTLANSEIRNDIAAKIDAIASITQYRLSEKIRTNKEIANFIRLLFNNKKPIQSQRTTNIEINYFHNYEDAKSYLNSLNDTDWEVLRFTPSQYNKEHHENYFDASRKTSHQVIGQEFDGVAIAVDSFFTYDESGDLVYRRGTYYAPTKMLFQNITRARKRLNLIIIANPQILIRCLSILE